MSCLDVMYQVYGPPQPYFAAAYSPYHQKLAFYSKMQEAAESGSSSSGSSSSSSSFSSHAPASIKEEECSPEKERPPEAEYINSRCVLFTYFQGDISSVVDEHFSRALSQPSSYSPSSAGAKASRSSSSSWRDQSYPMSQRSFPPSFWNSSYQPSAVSASSSLGSSLASPLSGPHSDIPFGTDPYSPASLHSHLHQGPPEPWHHAHHHHHHPYSLGGAINSQGSTYPRTSMHEVYSTHFDPRYSSLLVPASVRPHRITPTGTASATAQCDLGKAEPATSAWTTPGPFPGPTGEMGQGIGLNVDAARRYPFCGGPLLS
ncbi:transcription cofactor vestigial-like protein 2 isoform X2 [Bombina bombina]|uniref:transcription cofactor vestigial-like protein 2 isoform X2 n=1 Tax=Bombina bombina TaxID=8345 RepID=UPI00235B22DF|nr:transcription cofactor vestigial-like protein 2 isoform X2 [Bombina bombina]